MGSGVATESQASARKADYSDNIRTGLEADAIATALIDNLHCLQAKLPQHATRNDWYMALAYTVRDRMMHRYIATVESIAGTNTDAKVVAYLSAEFLTGPHLGNGLINLGIRQAVEEALSRVGQDLSSLLEQEEEPGLGNGGLGRLAACYMDSLATLNVPAVGYGIRYEFGIFDQTIRDGWQVEVTDKWLRCGNPWEIVRSEITFDVKLGGHTEPYHDEKGRYRVRWLPEKVFKGVAYDTPVPGYRVPTTNLLRLWKAEATESFDFAAFNVADYYGAVDEKVASETISKVLYPNDEPEAGKQLRLAQQYFFVSCSLQDMIRLLLIRGKPLDELHLYWAAQLNDTHPSIAVAELMRLLVDEHGMDWDQAWGITQQTCAYTNHTLLAEALERWPLPLFAKLLPRHLEFIYEINRRFLDDLRLRHPNDDQLIRRLSLIDEAGGKYVRMAHLASVGSHAINGVAALHTELLKQTVLSDFYKGGAGEVFQRHERCDAAALARAEQPEIERTYHSLHRRPMDSESGRRARAIGAAGPRRRLPEGLASRKGRQQTRPGRCHQGANGHHRGSAFHVRHPGEAPARVQAPAPERVVPGHSL
jgi:starch phosphorylase